MDQARAAARPRPRVRILVRHETTARTARTRQPETEAHADAMQLPCALGPDASVVAPRSFAPLGSESAILLQAMATARTKLATAADLCVLPDHVRAEIVRHRRRRG